MQGFLAENCCENYRQEIYVRVAISRANPASPANPFPFLFFGLIHSCGNWNETKDEKSKTRKSRKWNETKCNGILYRKNFMHVNTSCQRYGCRWQDLPSRLPSGYPVSLANEWGGSPGPSPSPSPVGGEATVQQFLIHMFRSSRFWFCFCFLSKSLRPRWFMIHARDSPKWKSCPQI